MDNRTDFWFYLEPYTFLFNEEERFVIYNTLNGAYIDCSIYPEAQELLWELHRSDKNYCAGLNKKQLKQKTLVLFIRKIRATFSGDIIKNTQGTPPFIFKPLLRLYSHPGNLRAKQENLLGLNSLLYLHEVSFYLENNCNKGCAGCHSYYKQFLHCTQTGKQAMQLNDYLTVIDQLELCQLDKINIVPGEQTDKELLMQLVQRLQSSPLKKEVILHDTSGREFKEFFIRAGFPVNIRVHLPADGNELQQQIDFYREQAGWTFIVTSEDEFTQLGQLEIPDGVRQEILPCFTGGNHSFFEKFVYTEWDDITGEPVDKQRIFRRQVLNENFFGKLTVFPSGDVFANINFPPVGNLLTQKLTEIVYQEISESKAWLKTREEGACKNCINKYLCPSPANYELVMNRFNLCHIRPEVNRQVP